MFDELDPDIASETTQPGEHALAYLLRTSPLGGDPASALGTARRLEVIAFVGEEVVDVRQVDGSSAVELGSDGVDPTAPALIRVGAASGGTDAPRLTRDARGWVFVPSFDMVGFVDSEGDADGPVRRPVTGETVLARGERLLVEVGPVIYVIQEVQASKRVPGVAVEVDTPMLSLLSFLGIGASLFGYALNTVPPPPQSSTLDLIKESLVLDLARIKPPPPVAQRSTGPAEGAHKGPEGASHKGHPKPEGAPSNREMATRVLRGLDGMLASIGDSNLPPGVAAGIAGLQGRATSTDGNGFNARGDGFGGGGHTDFVGLDTESRHEGRFAPKDDRVRQPGEVTVPREVILLGSLDRAEVDKVIKQNMASIRYCYQKELQAHPGLAGKVSVRFTIAADGTVSSATTRPTAPMPAVEACLTSRFLKMRFPEPKGGGMVLVTYPFVFSE